MKKLFFICLIKVFSISIVSGIELNITNFGAERGKLSTTAIQAAVDSCYNTGGGTVIVPSGLYITGSIRLKSNINLYLSQGAELRSSEDLNDFIIGENRYGMIFCQEAINISITGNGTINALGSFFYDATQNHGVSSSLGNTKEYDRVYTRQKENYLPEGTFFSDGPIKRKPRPGMTVVFFHCNNVTIRDITVIDTPVWAVRFSYCEDVLVDGIRILNNLLIPNSDGIHLTVSRNVRISNCEIKAGDDAIIVTGFARIENTPGFDSREQDGYVHGNKTIYSENIQVTNCHLQSRSSAIRIGYGQHPIRRCIFNNIIISESNRGIGIFARDSSSIEELIFSDIIIETRLHNGIWWGNGEPIHISAITRFKDEPVGQIKDVQFNNITASCGHGIILYALEDSPVENIRFKNIRLQIKMGKETPGYGGNFDLRPTAYVEKQIFEHDIPGLYAQYANKLSIEDFEVVWEKGLPDFYTHAIECLSVKDLILDKISGTGNPGSPDSRKTKLVKTLLIKE